MKKLPIALSLLTLATTLFSCGESSKIETPQEGEITIAADESLKPIVDAQVMAYNAHYPKAVIHVKYLPEQKAIKMMLDDSAEIAFVTRGLTVSEQDVYFKSKKLPYQPATMALDGVAIIANKANADTNITVPELKSMFDGSANNKIKLVFDNSNSSNLYYMMNKLGIKDISKANIEAANGNEEVIEYIKKDHNAIGFIGGNWISDMDDKKAVDFKKAVRIMAVAEKQNATVYYLPNTYDLKARKYPLERKMILHTKETVWGVAKGFIRFSCAQIGQLVTEKMGLVPYYNLPRTVVLDDKSLAEQDKQKDVFRR